MSDWNRNDPEDVKRAIIDRDAKKLVCRMKEIGMEDLHIKEACIEIAIDYAFNECPTCGALLFNKE